MDKKMMDCLQEAEKVLVGIGEDFANEEDAEIRDRAYRRLAQMLEGKDYFLVSLDKNGVPEEMGFDGERIAAPFAGTEEETKPAWDAYQKWLSMTLNRRLLVLELGVGFAYPGILRFPFEKVVYFNQKAQMIRVHGKLFQVSGEIAERMEGIACCPAEWLLKE